MSHFTKVWGSVAAFAACVAACATSGTTADLRLDPITVDRLEPSPLAPVSFLEGCWTGPSDSGGVLMEERWTSSEGGVMLATTRFLREGEVVGWEYSHLTVMEGDIVLTPYPNGERSEHSFVRTDGEPGRAVFEAPEHDFPQRITYELDDEGALHVSIENLDEMGRRSWTLALGPC